MNLTSGTTKSIFSFLERLDYKFQDLGFRFPIETLENLLKQFYKDYEQSAFLLQANKNVSNMALKKITSSYLLSVPVQSQNNEHLYIGMSDLLTFLILFDEPNPEEQNVSSQTSRFYLTFDINVINTIFDYFYKNFCNSLSLKEKKLLLKLKNVQTNEINAFYVSKFQEALLISALNENNKIRQTKILEAISFTDESVAITDLAGNIKESNPNFEKYFGSNPDRISIREMLSQEIVDAAISETLSNSKWQLEVSLKDTKNKSGLLLVSCYLFKDELSRPNGFVFTFKDITELKKLDNLNKQLITKLRERNVELNEVNKRLVEADRIKTDLLSVVSHELKTPVSSILGFSELIAARDCDENTTKKYAEQINESAKNLDRLVTDYLDVACNGFGVASDKMITMPVNLVDLIRLCYEEEKLNFGSFDMKFQFELNCLGFEPIIITEAENMKKLFGNLINNSLKYSPSGGKISVKFLNDGENVTVSIADQGVGLTTEQSKQVFEPFYRADNSITREFTGIGLGLAVSKKIVELYNGSIWCEPGVDLGTVFYVTLPVNPHKSKLEQKTKVEAEKETRELQEIEEKTTRI